MSSGRTFDWIMALLIAVVSIALVTAASLP